MEGNVMSQAVEELKALKQEIEDANNLKQELIKDIADVRIAVKDNDEFISSIKKVGDEIKASCEIVKAYYERMESLSANISTQLEEAKRLENRMMMEKMDLLLNKADLIAKSASLEISPKDAGVVDNIKTTRATRKKKESVKESTVDAQLDGPNRT